MNISEENPFEDEIIANEWIRSVESEKDSFRDREIYPYLAKWVQKVDPKLVVEVGSGQGICSEKISLIGRLYIGVEPSKFLISRAIEKYNSSNVSFLKGNAYNIPLRDTVADGIFSVNVLFHLKKLEKSLNEFARILKSGGDFLIITANPDSYSDWEKLYSITKDNEEQMTGSIRVPGGKISKSIFYKHSLLAIRESLKNNGLLLEKEEVLEMGEKMPSFFVAFSGHKAQL